MLSEGDVAPGFELPALVDGEKRRVALAEYLGDDIVILAFYPADFNPACDDESCDLGELDLFTMQKDVTILGISPDSVYSHRAFATQYDLNVPLLADTEGEVAQRYDIDLVDDIGQRLVERAVAVVDHDGTITYSWSTEDMTELPRVEAVKDALAGTGGDDTAFARYRVGHAHYTEGRRAFTSAMENFQQREWVMTQHDFQQAREEFEAAADRFDTALRFVDDESLVPIYEGANEKATALWQAADWLVRSASAYSSGNGAEGQELRGDAEIPLSTVREYEEPPDPDGEWPPEMATLEKAETDDHSILPTETDVVDAALAVDIDEAVDDTDEEPAAETVPATEGSGDTATDDAAAGDSDTADDIDDDELAEIQAELAANNPDSEPSVEEVTEESTAIVEAPPMSESDDAPGDEPVAAASGDGPVDQSDEASAEADTAGRDDADAVGGDDTAVERGGEAAVEPGGENSTDAAERAIADNSEADDPVGSGATESDGMDTDESEPELELAEPDPNPLGADGPPVSPDEAPAASSEPDESGEESSPDE